jgi:2-phospho-L-lactate guanylyltransferase
MTVTRSSSRWSIVIPFKGAPAAKSRMAERFDLRERGALADAFLRDVVHAAISVPTVDRILVVAPHSVSTPSGDDDRVATVPDPGTGLNDAVAAGIRAARAADPGVGVAVLTGDLPLIRSGDLSEALQLASAHERAFIPDKDGTGTTMLAAGPGILVEPCFGIGSAAAHLARGHVRLELPAASSLRFDVDTPAELELAVQRGGLGPATRAALASLASPVDPGPHDGGA